jgi:hypothetical protein
MSKFDYNKRRHLELLKLKYSQKKVLTSTEESELKEYSCLLEATLDWETKEQYIDLLEELISGKINSFQFYLEFRKRNDLNGEIFDICISYEDVFESHLSKEKTDLHYLEFDNSIKKIYLKIQNFLNEE